MGSFDPSFVALRGDAEQTAATAKEFKVFYAKVPGKTEGSYTMDHTAGTYVFDAAGKLRLFVRYGSGAEALAADLKRCFPAPEAVSSGGLGQGRAHLLHRGDLDLADALGADAVVGRQLVQRHAAGAVVVHLQPAFLDDAAAARIQRVERAGDAVAGQPVALGGFRAARRLVRLVGR